MTISSLPSFPEMNRVLEKLQLNDHPSQLHGLICGYICANEKKEAPEWDVFFSRVKKNKKLADLFVQLYESSYHQLTEFSFDFSLLLPTDDENINLRAESLGLWCQGFLSALRQANVPIENRDPSEVTDALEDILEIAQLNFGDIGENEEDEAAYYELVEHVRLSVLMIFQELQPHSYHDDILH